MYDSASIAIGFTEVEARRLIGEGMVSPRRHRNGVRYLLLKVSLEKVRLSKNDRFKEMLKERISLPVAEPYVIAEYIGGNRVFKHVAHRCSAAQPYMAPVSGAWM